MYDNVTDDNERMAFLRATAINKLVDCVSNVFIENYDTIMSGDFEKSLASHLPDFEKNALEKCREFSLKNIYKHNSVVKIELTGFNVIGELIDEFVQAILNGIIKPLPAKKENELLPKIWKTLKYVN